MSVPIPSVHTTPVTRRVLLLATVLSVAVLVALLARTAPSAPNGSRDAGHAPSRGILPAVGAPAPAPPPPAGRRRARRRPRRALRGSCGGRHGPIRDRSCDARAAGRRSQRLRACTGEPALARRGRGTPGWGAAAARRRQRRPRPEPAALAHGRADIRGRAVPRPLSGRRRAPRARGGGRRSRRDGHLPAGGGGPPPGGSLAAWPRQQW